MAESHSLGKRGEKLAVEHLLSKGYEILERNWSTGRREIDIIACDENYIIFIEVKTRTSDFQVHPRDAVSVPKQRNIIFAAQKYIERNLPVQEARFDIISIIFDGQYYEIEHIQDAFYPTL
ncbi:MAG: YraN family protein [Marinilabiliaceae bacterium]|jgi:putative endonuclease|nr:YraN family protein [Marinilabiliaceae bacterium]